MAFADDFYLSVHLGDARVRAVMWSDDDRACASFSGRFSPGNAAPGEWDLSDEHWRSLRRWAARQLWWHAARRSAIDHVSGNDPGLQSPGLWSEDMTRALPQALRDAGHGGMKGAPGLTRRSLPCLHAPPGRGGEGPVSQGSDLVV